MKFKNYGPQVLDIRDHFRQQLGEHAGAAIDWMIVSSLPVSMINNGTVKLRDWYRAASCEARKAPPQI